MVGRLERLEMRVRHLERKLFHVSASKPNMSRVLNPPVPISMYCEKPDEDSGVIGRFYVPFDCELRRLLVFVGEAETKPLQLTVEIVEGKQAKSFEIVLTGKMGEFCQVQPVQLKKGSRVTFKLVSQQLRAVVKDIWIGGMVYVDMREVAKCSEGCEDAVV